MKIPNFSFLIDTSSALYFLTMEDPLVTFETTGKGKPMVRDSNNYTYVANTSFTEVKYWNVWLKCAQLEFEPESELDL